MSRVEGKSSRRAPTGAPSVLPCNFRSAGRLSNESGRTLTTLNEGLARNLTNSLDVYLGTGLEVKLIDLEQLTMEDYRARSATSGYMLPCVAKPTANSILLEMDGDLMFTVIDLLLGGTGGVSGITRELTEIDEEILEDVGTMIAGQIERVWQPMGLSLVPGSCVKPNVGYRVFPPTEKVHRIHFELSMEGMAGGLYLALPASLSSHLVRNVRSDSATSKQGRGYQKPPSLEQRIMGCEFALAGELPELKVSVRDLARISVGSVLTLSAPAASPGQLTLEGKSYFVAAPVGQGNMKAMQLLSAAQIEQNDLDGNEDASHAGF